MGTQAALDNPRCTSGNPEYGPYGRFDTAAVGQGPPCVKVWKEGDDNGGATTAGVTEDRIKVVAYLPNAEQFSKDPVPPLVRTTKAKGTHVDGIHDYLVPTMRFYETWGRDIELHYVVSGGSDEAAQRADAVTIKEMKPFAAVMISSNEDKSVLESELAAAKIMTFGYNASPADSAQQSPYRWNSADNDAVAVNAAEVLAKQIAGRKTEHGGDDVNGQTRKIGIVHTDSLDVDAFLETFKRYGGTEVEAAVIPASPPEAIQAAAPTIITRMKAAGVTTIVPFVGSTHMTPLMEVATQQDYFPEWFFTGASYQDIAILVRNYPQEQAQHAFGTSFIAPWIEPDPVPATGLSNSQKIDALNWYWGLDAGTYTARYGQALGYWLLGGVHAAGSEPDAQDVQAGPVRHPRTVRRLRGSQRRDHGRVRQGAEAAVRLVRDRRLRLLPLVVGRRDRGGVGRHRHRRDGRRVVRRRQALRGDHVAEEAVHLVRQVERDQQLRQPPRRTARVRG